MEDQDHYLISSELSTPQSPSLIPVPPPSEPSSPLLSCILSPPPFSLIAQHPSSQSAFSVIIWVTTARIAWTMSVPTVMSQPLVTPSTLVSLSNATFVINGGTLPNTSYLDLQSL